VEVQIVTFPETKVVMLTHFGTAAEEHETARRLAAWKVKNGRLDQDRYRTYGLHYSRRSESPTERYRVDFCLSVEEDVDSDDSGVVQTVIPGMRCALARDIGSRLDNKAAAFLVGEWLPGSGEEMSGYPLIFHYVNVGPSVKPDEAITDVYLPLK